MKEEEQERLLKIKEAIEQKGSLAFKYCRSDGRIIKHNTIYPREIYGDEPHIYFKAYCYFSHEIRLFRLDRVRSLRSTAKKEPLKVKDYLIGVVLILFVPVIYVTWTLTGGDPKGEWVLVTLVTDGDTIEVGRGWRHQKVRLIGVDTPETVHPKKGNNILDNSTKVAILPPWQPNLTHFKKRSFIFQTPFLVESISLLGVGQMASHVQPAEVRRLPFLKSTIGGNVAIDTTSVSLP